MQSGVHFYAIVCDLSVESFDWCWSWCAVHVHVPVFVNLLSIIVVIRLCYGDICFVVMAIILCTLSARWCTCKNCLLSTTDWHTKLQDSACSSWLNSTTDNSLQEMDQPFYANGCAWWSWCVLLSKCTLDQADIGCGCSAHSCAQANHGWHHHILTGMLSWSIHLPQLSLKVKRAVEAWNVERNSCCAWLNQCFVLWSLMTSWTDYSCVGLLFFCTLGSRAM